MILAPAPMPHLVLTSSNQQGADCSFAEYVWVWNRIQHWTMPNIHIRICHWLEECWNQGKREIILLAFRNCGKSVLVGLFCCWLLARNANLCILVIAADQQLAIKMTAHIGQVIAKHPLMSHVRPGQSYRWARDRFTVARTATIRDPSVLARGIDANLTGSRADVVICDDVEVPKNCNTVHKRQQLRQKLAEIDYVIAPGGYQIYIGTPHSTDSIYLSQGDTPCFLDGFKRLVIPLVDDNGYSNWPERFPPSQIKSMQKRSGPIKFASQMELRPIARSHQVLDPDKLMLYDDNLEYRQANQHGGLHIGHTTVVSASCWWDPAWGGSHGCGSVIAAVFSDSYGHFWLHRIAWLTHNPDRHDIDEATQLCRQVLGFLHALFLTTVHIETNGLGRFLPGLLRRESQRSRLACSIVEVHQTRPKSERILEAFDIPLAGQALHAHRSILRTPLIEEMRQWSPQSSTSDDGLDAVSGCLLSQPTRLSSSLSMGQRRPPTWQMVTPTVAPHRFDI